MPGTCFILCTLIIHSLEHNQRSNIIFTIKKKKLIVMFVIIIDYLRRINNKTLVFQIWILVPSLLTAQYGQLRVIILQLSPTHPSKL